MTASPTLSVRVRATTWEAEGILGFELVPLASEEPLPVVTAGAHVDLHLPNGLLRSYSLLNDPGETHRYCIGVNRDANSRGGSQYLHEALRTGAVLTLSAPRNNFPLDESSPFNVFVAGGIGITPMLGMIARSQALGTPWRLHYAARTRAPATFLGLLGGRRPGGCTRRHAPAPIPPSGAGGRRRAARAGASCASTSTRSPAAGCWT